ncbi:MAG: ribonuclease R, partial [Alphaproteobacteria bacterium]|nr:ribonuclease R [Alphaproteobacteria bacterium]
ALMVGDKAMARLHKISGKLYTATILKKIDTASARVVGFIQKNRNGYVLSPIDRRAKHDYDIAESQLNGARVGQIVVAESQPQRGEQLRKKVKVIDIVGEANDPKAISLMALYEANLRPFFPENVVAETAGMDVPPLGKRTDLRDYPLVTIDGADARDFDDAVFAEPDSDPKNPNGYHLIVAIADVAHYVRAGSALDKEAYLRGNSTYFPDRVLPMLPEKLSNDVCSLRPNEPRATLAVHMWIDDAGKLLRYKFVRGLMLSRARLTYEQVQRAREGAPDDTTQPLMDRVITPLYQAWKILDQARIKRGALDLDLPERKIIVNDRGEMTGVAVRERLDSHKLIEEFMILANVAAAEALEAKTTPCIYRIHDRPTGEKLLSANSFLDAFGLSLPKGGVAGAHQLNHLLEKAKKLPMGFLVSEIILRSQAQAVYDPENIGHFGLALTRYAHFTSPIRRYADLMVHRGLIRAYHLGDGGLSDHEMVKMAEIAEHISGTERTSAEAERNAVDRFTAAYLRDKISMEFEGRISGVTRFGLFIKLNAIGADGLVPIRSLPSDYYVHEESQHALIGTRTGRIFRLGAPVLIRVLEADPMTGSSIFELVGAQFGADVEGYKSKDKGGYRGPKGSQDKRHKNSQGRGAEDHKKSPHKKRSANKSSQSSHSKHDEVERQGNAPQYRKNKRTRPK